VFSAAARSAKVGALPSTTMILHSGQAAATIETSSADGYREPGRDHGRAEHVMTHACLPRVVPGTGGAPGRKVASAGGKARAWLPHFWLRQRRSAYIPSCPQARKCFPLCPGHDLAGAGNDLGDRAPGRAGGAGPQASHAPVRAKGTRRVSMTDNRASNIRSSAESEVRMKVHELDL